MSFKKISEYTKSKLTFLIDQLFPFASILRSNRLLAEKDKKIQAGQLFYMSGAETVDIRMLKTYYEKPFEYKKLFEEKAKTNISLVAFAGALAIGVIGFCLNLKTDHIAINGRILDVIGLVAGIIIVYLATAACLSFQMLGSINMTYEVFPSDELLEYDKKRQLMIECTELNVNTNHKRNNYLYAANKSAVIAILLLNVLFVLLYYAVHTSQSTNIPELVRGQQELSSKVSSLSSEQAKQAVAIESVQNQISQIAVTTGKESGAVKPN